MTPTTPHSPAVLDNLPYPLVLVSGNRRVTYANSAATALFDNIALDADLALTLRHPQVLDAVERALETGQPQADEISLSGTVTRVFDLHIVPVSAEAVGAETDGVLLTLNEKTAEIRAEQMRADFVANASHELRSPLSAILGFIETLQGPAKDDADARGRFLGIMDREAGRMNRLIDDLLSLSRVELDEHVRPQGKVDLSHSLNSVVDLLSERAAAKNIEIKLSGGHNIPEIPGDADQLFQVFRNLIENAVNHSPAGSVVSVNIDASSTLTDSSTPGVAVHIVDQGEGIAKQHLPRLTERFYRADPARGKSAGDGPVSTGLGLAIVKHILNRHRGRLIIESEVGEGSTFSVVLPRN